MIKLTNIYHEYNNIGAKPNDQFQKKRIDSTKIPNVNCSENPIKMHEFMHEIMKIKAKRKGIKVLPALGEKNLAKNLVENDKKSSVEPCQVKEREESLKRF